MKKDTHPQYYPEAKVTCACGNTFTVGSTKPEISVEVCSDCHPFFTGQEKVMDTAGRVEKFRNRQKQSAPAKPVKKADSATEKTTKSDTTKDKKDKAESKSLEPKDENQESNQEKDEKKDN